MKVWKKEKEMGLEEKSPGGGNEERKEPAFSNPEGVELAGEKRGYWGLKKGR